MAFRRLHIRQLPIDEITVDDFIARTVELSGLADQSRYICYLNAHVYNLAQKDRQLAAILNGAAICYADGASVVWAANRFGGRIKSRMTAADFLPDAIDALHKAGRRVFLLGGKPGIAERAAERLAKTTPGFVPVGVHHGYTDHVDADELISSVRTARPDLLIVGMGTPTQERWIADHIDRLQIPLVWAVGALLDFSAGEERRCPDWMGNYGFEWLYRLSVNPRRMASRYLLGNPRFVWSVLTANGNQRGDAVSPST